tara:strand:- start:1022 stop:1735 length:714 start_codon:yes stop_codon:yes gene_type:complete
MSSHNIFAIIPARKGSKGIDNKNLQLIGNKPMIQFTFDSAKQVARIDSLVLSSDDEKIISLAKKIGVDAPFIRPSNLSLDDSKTSDVVLHSLEWYEASFGQMPKNIMLLQPTSPFRTSNDINHAINKFISSKKKTLVSVTEVSQHPGDCLVKSDEGKFSRLDLRSDSHKEIGRQGFLETFFIDGSIYISDTMEFLASNDLVGSNPEICLIPQSHGIDIDTNFDLSIARAMHSSGIVS